MDPRDTVGRIYKEGYYALLHCIVVSEKKTVSCFSFCKSIGAMCCHGNQNSDPKPNVTFPHHSPQIEP